MVQTSATAAKSPQSAFDLRVWIEKVRALGQLREATGADLKFELGAISELNAKRFGPALVFDKFPGYPDGFRVMTGSMLNSKTLGLTMGIEENLATLPLTNRISDVLRDLDHKLAEFPVEYVENGPVMENQQFGDDVDLTIFPTPLWHELDGGVFIGTGGIQIHQDPETGWFNVGAYRVQRHTKNSVGNYISPGHHGNIIRQKYWDRGEPCPVAMVFGSHPLLLLLGGSEVPDGVSEFNWAGAIMNQRVPVIKGPVTGLPIPADAEIVIEGYATKGDVELEGPFGEFTGYYAGGQKQETVVRVKALYYRNHPILLGCPPCRPLHDFSYYSSVFRSASVKEFLRKAGVPAVKSVWVSEAGASRGWVVTSIQQKYAGHAAQAASLAVQCQAGGLMNRFSIVVDEDIDPSNHDDVIWALSTRCDPAADIDIIRQCWSNPLDPMICDSDKLSKRLWNSRAIVNACRPWDRLQSGDYPAVAEATPALLKATQEKWGWLWK